LCGGGLDESLDAVQACDLFLPFLGGEDGVDDGREDGLDGVGVDTLDNSQSSNLGSSLDSRDLVTDGGEDRGEQDDEVWLNACGNLGVL